MMDIEMTENVYLESTWNYTKIPLLFRYFTKGSGDPNTDRTTDI